MSKHIGSLQVGDTLEVKGPISKLPLKDIAAKKAVGMVRRGLERCQSLTLSECCVSSVLALFVANTGTDSMLTMGSHAQHDSTLALRRSQAAAA